MNHENSKAAVRKQKAIHELKDFIRISSYLAFFFCAVALYTNILVGQSRTWYVSYGAAIITALVVAKVILIGNYAKLGKRAEAKPLIVRALYKAFLYSLLVFAFHFVEESIKRHIHHVTLATALTETHIRVQLARALVVFCAFIPLFAYMEMRRVLGEDTVRQLMFSKRTVSPTPNTEVDLPRAGD